MNEEDRLRSLMELASISENLITEVISARVRLRALLELLEAKGVLGGDEFDRRASEVWDRDFEALAAELWAEVEEAD